MTHRFIVYQYGKVGSTSMTAALNKMRDVDAYQCHFLGEQAFQNTINSLMRPQMSEYFFEHSAGQLVDNLRAYRCFLRRELDDSPVTLLTVCREPFGWFRSAISQDIKEHCKALERMLRVRGKPPRTRAETVEQGLGLLLDYLVWIIDHFESVDALTSGVRYGILKREMDYHDKADFTTLMSFLNTFLRPHTWFQSHFEVAIGVAIDELQPLSNGVNYLPNESGGIYLLRYESLEQGFATVLSDLGIQSRRRLPKRNRGKSKPFSRELARVFESETARQLQAKCHSSATVTLGYEPGGRAC